MLFIGDAKVPKMPIFLRLNLSRLNRLNSAHFLLIIANNFAMHGQFS